MEGVYPICLAGKEAGTATVRREGLYWKICCRCRITGDVIYKVVVNCAQQREDLGILVPEGNGFGLSARISVKRLSGGEMRFQAVPRHTKALGKFIPVYPDEPFVYLDRLKKSRFIYQDKQPGLIIQE